MFANVSIVCFYFFDLSNIRGLELSVCSPFCFFAECYSSWAWVSKFSSAFSIFYVSIFRIFQLADLLKFRYLVILSVSNVWIFDCRILELSNYRLFHFSDFVFVLKNIFSIIRCSTFLWWEDNFRTNFRHTTVDENVCMLCMRCMHAIYAFYASKNINKSYEIMQKRVGGSICGRARGPVAPGGQGFARVRKCYHQPFFAWSHKLCWCFLMHRMHKSAMSSQQRLPRRRLSSCSSYCPRETPTGVPMDVGPVVSPCPLDPFNLDAAVATATTEVAALAEMPVTLRLWPGVSWSTLRSRRLSFSVGVALYRVLRRLLSTVCRPTRIHHPSGSPCVVGMLLASRLWCTFPYSRAGTCSMGWSLLAPPRTRRNFCPVGSCTCCKRDTSNRRVYVEVSGTSTQQAIGGPRRVPLPKR